MRNKAVLQRTLRIMWQWGPALRSGDVVDRVIPENENTALNVRWQVAQDRAFRQIVAAGEATSRAEQDYIVKVDATGLAPGTLIFIVSTPSV